MPALSKADNIPQALKILEGRIAEQARSRQAPRLAHGRWTFSHEAMGDDTHRVPANGAIPFDTVETTPEGCSINNGIITVERAGRYNVQASLHFASPASGIQWLWIAQSDSVDSPRYSISTVPYTVSDIGALSVTALDVELGAGDPVCAAVWFSGGGNGTRPTLPARKATNLSIQQIA